MTYYRVWGTLWHDWLTSIDHKKIGIMYCILGFDAAARLHGRAHDARPARPWRTTAPKALPPHHYAVRCGVIAFLCGHAFGHGLMNFVVPLQIGARDVASVPEQLQLLDDRQRRHPGDLLFVGEFGQTGWLAYPPLSGIQYSPGGC
jgi:cytochrome o ubiquinol oxidase subunit 1